MSIKRNLSDITSAMYQKNFFDVYLYVNISHLFSWRGSSFGNHGGNDNVLPLSKTTDIVLMHGLPLTGHN